MKKHQLSLRFSFGRIFVFCICFLFGAQALQSQISPAQNMTLRGRLNFPGLQSANICGYAQNGREYALVGNTGGTAIVDVTNPDTPRLIKQVAAVSSAWREIKIYRNYAYITTEGVGQGLQIVNLSTLPDPNVAVKNYTGADSSLVQIRAIHALHIDTTRGFVYCYGGDSRITLNGSAQTIDGAVVLDIATDPWNPKFVGHYKDFYIHDGYVNNDTLYAAHIENGFFSIIDFRNKQVPVVLSQQTTPTAFTHNTWPSVNGKFIYTTDENAGSYLACYDVSVPTNIRLVDRIRSVSGEDAIIHNTHILNDYAITSWYTEGATIVDVHRPTNLVQVGQYDTWNGTAAAFNGCWGVYPYLPSGNIIASNIEDGLFVITPQYKRACYLEGNVVDSVTRQTLSGVRVKIASTDPDKMANSNVRGDYATGQATAGLVNVTYSKPGYLPKTVQVTLVAGQVVLKNMELVAARRFAVSGTVRDAQTNALIPSAKVFVKNADFTYRLQTNSQGAYSLPEGIEGNYSVFVGSWGYLHTSSAVNLNQNVSRDFLLTKGYQDDFWENFSWLVGGTAQPGGNQGRWERAVPVGINFNNIVTTPSTDFPVDLGDECYVTGNGGGGGGANDVDALTTLTSPVMKLRSYTDPRLNFAVHYVVTGGSGTAPNDTLRVIASNGLTEAVILKVVTGSTGWFSYSNIALKNFLQPTDSMTIRFEANDLNPGHIVEALIDAFKVVNGTVSTIEIANNWQLSAFPNPFSETVTVEYELEATDKNAKLLVFNTLGQLVEQKNLSENPKGVVSFGENLPKGLYVLSIQTTEKTSKQVKVIKQ
jgi:choice-of-anchor B domain-containing protein